MQVTTTTPLFAATLRPDRSLRLAGGWLALSLAGVVGTPFLLAIPDFLLPGLIAFGLSAGGMLALGLRQARRQQRGQQVTVWPDQIEIATLAPGRERQLQRFALADVRLRLERDGFERTTAVILRAGDMDVPLGGFLSTADKASFARALGAALRKARRAA